jgi:hypothetical protein
MPATAPRRIDTTLLARAESSGAIFHRSGTEQLEHWAILGAAVETVLGLSSVAKMKTIGQTYDLDEMLSKTGLAAANKDLARSLEKQPFPQYSVDPKSPKGVVMHLKGGRKIHGRVVNGVFTPNTTRQ